jgi:hypothetical protein
MSGRVVGLGLSLAITVAALGCGSQPTAVSCTISTPTDEGLTLTVCQQFDGLTPIDQELWSTSCYVSQGSADAPTNATARFDYAPCTRVGVLGGCQPAGSMTITSWYYAGGPYTAADIPPLCAQGSTFVSP